MSRRQLLSGIGWSGTFLLISRGSALIAVPLALHGVGTDLYAAWVLAGTLILSQGLVDFGIGAATVRFVAMGYAARQRRTVLSAFRRSLVFYAALSAAVVLALVLLAPTLVGTVSYLHGSEASGAVRLVRYAAVSFALTNVVLLEGALLQGMNRVGAAYRDQTIGWLAYVPVLAIGLEADLGVDALGLAWIVAYGLQIALLTRSCLVATRDLAGDDGELVSWRELASVGGRWQVSNWADFATFQLPRLLSGLALASKDVVAIDLALRAAQVPVMPLFAAYPVVLPAVSERYASAGREGARSLLDRWYLPLVSIVLLVLAVILPLFAPSIAVWTDRPLDSIDPLLSGAILVGVVAHSSTGLLSSALLAIGRLRPVVTYKTAQLALGVVLLPASVPFGAVAMACMLGVVLTGPALVFNVRVAGQLGLRSLGTQPRLAGRLGVVALAGFAAVAAAFGLLEPPLGTAPALSAAAATALAVLALGVAWSRQLLPSGVASAGGEASVPLRPR